MVPEGVVDRLEPVEVDRQHCDDVAGDPLLQDVDEPFLQQQPIAQRRQAVGSGLLGNARAFSQLFRDVLDGDQSAAQDGHPPDMQTLAAHQQGVVAGLPR